MPLQVAFDDSSLVKAVSAAAACTNRPVRPLMLQALLQLPRLADDHGYVEHLQAEGLITQLANEIPSADRWNVSSPESLRDLRFSVVDEAIALEVMAGFHYLRSPRKNSRTYGLLSESQAVVALAVSSPLDVQYLEGLLKRRTSTELISGRVISRVFAFGGAPTNSISFLLSRTAKAERALGTSNLVTYVNPNMGFTGSSYRATGWDLIGSEPGTTYRYIDDRYVTDRSLSERYGDLPDNEYRQLLGDRYVVSRMPLQPLLVFHTAIVG